MYFAHCFNWNAGDTFYATAETKDEALKILEKAYKDYYNMTNADARENGYKTILDYICHAKEVTLIEIKTNQPTAVVYGCGRTYCKDAKGKVHSTTDNTYTEYIPVDD